MSAPLFRPPPDPILSTSSFLPPTPPLSPPPSAGNKHFSFEMFDFFFLSNMSNDFIKLSFRAYVDVTFNLFLNDWSIYYLFHPHNCLFSIICILYIYIYIYICVCGCVHVCNITIFAYNHFTQ